MSNKMVLKAYDEPNMTMKAHQTPGMRIATDHIHKNKKVLDEITEDKIKEWDNKVDKVAGKDLSTNDFTDAEKEKLESLSNYDDKEIRKSLSEISETSKQNSEKVDSIGEQISSKADLIDGAVPDGQLPYYNKTQNLYVGENLLFPIVFVDVDDSGNFYLREDGRGDYLLYIPIDGVPRLKYIGKAITDDVTGVSYKLTVSNGEVDLKQVI